MPDGSVIEGQVDYRGEAGKRFLLPDDLTGKRVVDFGTWTGFWAIEAKKRGAVVVATDRWRPVLDVAKGPLDAWGIPYVCTGDLDGPIDLVGHFDLVLFYGILYHLRNPYQGLKNAVDSCKIGGTVIVESAVNQGKVKGLADNIPLLWVIDGTHHGDTSNYFMPNEAGLLQLCKMAGLVILEVVYSTEGGNDRMTVLCGK
jgi:tRNA (mo5U34)-methyltransferase